MNDTALPRDEGRGVGWGGNKTQHQEIAPGATPSATPCPVMMDESVAQPGPQFPQMTISESMNCKKMN